MTDKELLELAAKAAGINFEIVSCRTGRKGNFGLIEYSEKLSVRDENTKSLWNPLEDDGDALRLAVKLRINIEHLNTISGKKVGVNTWPVSRGECMASEEEGYIKDSYAATRRAIVRAASEIGKIL